MAEHHLSKLTTGMVTPPVIPGTKIYSTQHDRATDRPGSSTMQEYYDEDTLAIHQPEPPDFEPVGSLERDPGLVPFEVNRESLTADFYQKLQQLKNEHSRTVDMLKKLYVEADTRCHHAEHYPIPVRRDLDKTTAFVTQNGSGTAHDDSESSDGCLDDDIREDAKNVRFRDTIETRNYESVPSDRLDRIKEMWDDFRLRDYLSPTIETEVREKRIEPKRPQSAPAKKTKSWSPIITIPKPFSMTIREEEKREKSHTRSSQEIAKAARERLEQEELELQKMVRARDPPAHTFLPLFQEIMERQEQRSRMNRENSGRALEALVKPFSFAERDEKKLTDKKKLARSEKRAEKREIKKMAQFVANPVPLSVYDPTVSDRIKEDKLYRKIKVKLRSEDLMRSSALPPRMHSHELMYADRKNKRTKMIKKANKLSFKPEIHGVPDFEALHRRQQMEKEGRRMELETTTMQPFDLSSSSRSKKKMAFQVARDDMEQEDEEFRKSMRKLRERRLSATLNDSVPTRMTETARLRLEETRKALRKAEKELEELKQQDKVRKERRKEMAKEVLVRSMMADRDVPESEEYRKEKLKLYQKQQRARDQQYRQELRAMNDRLKSRPLLFEQQTQNSARLHAEKRYEEILRNSGLSDDFLEGNIRKRNTAESLHDDYSDDEFETAIVDSGPKASNGVSDSESEVEEEIASEESEDEKNLSQTKVKKHLQFDI